MATEDRILLIGTGRVAFHLGHALKNAGTHLVGLVGRNPERTSPLARELGVPAFEFGQTLPDAEINLIAVSDDAIATVAAQLPASDAVFIHTSGASGLERLAPHEHRAVLWPLMTLSPGQAMDLRQVPLITDAGTEKASQAVKLLAERISERVTALGHTDRELVHLAAAMCTNLPLFLLGEAQRLLSDAEIDPKVLLPSFRVMAAKAESIGAQEALTGPARRGDQGTIQRHLDRLAHEPDLRRAYGLLSTMILRAHGHKDHGPTDV